MTEPDETALYRLFLLGEGEALEALAEIASHLGYGELHRGDDPPPVLSARDHVVLSARTATGVRELLRAVLAAGEAGYVGMAGAEKDALVALLKLSADRVPKARLDRVAAPAGRSTGAVTPGEVAVSIAAELVAARRRRGEN